MFAKMTVVLLSTFLVVPSLACLSCQTNGLNSKIAGYALTRFGHLRSMNVPVSQPLKKKVELNVNCELLLIPEVKKELSLSMHQKDDLKEMFEAFSVDASSAEQDDEIKQILLPHQLDALASIFHRHVLLIGSVEQVRNCQSLSWLADPSSDVRSKLQALVKGKSSQWELMAREKKSELVKDILEVLTEQQRSQFHAKFEPLKEYMDLNSWFPELDFPIWIWQMENVGSSKFEANDDMSLTQFVFAFDRVGSISTDKFQNRINLTDLVKGLRIDTELGQAVALTNDQQQRIDDFFDERRALSQEWAMQWLHIQDGTATKPEQSRYKKEKEKFRAIRKKTTDAFMATVLLPHQTKFLMDSKSAATVMSHGLAHELIQGELQQELGVSATQTKKLNALIEKSIKDFKSISTKLETDILDELNQIKPPGESVGVFVLKSLKHGRGEVLIRLIKQLSNSH